MDSIHLESFHMHIDFQYAEAVRNIGQKYLELINTQDKDWIIEEYRDSKFKFVSKHLEVHRGDALFSVLFSWDQNLFFLYKFWQAKLQNVTFTSRNKTEK